MIRGLVKYALLIELFHAYFDKPPKHQPSCRLLYSARQPVTPSRQQAAAAEDADWPFSPRINRYLGS